MIIHFDDQAKSKIEMEETNELGLTKGHAYAVTAIQRIGLVAGARDNMQLEMIKLRNPWGPGYEWKGPFCDG